MKYSYKAIDVNGNEITGDLEAEKTEDVGTWLSDRGYIVVSITQATLKSIVGDHHKYLRINQKDMSNHSSPFSQKGGGRQGLLCLSVCSGDSF